MKMNAQYTLYNVHGISCNIAQKHTSVQKESPPMTDKMSLNSPIAEGTRLWCSSCILSIEIITKCSTVQNLDTSFHKNCSQVARRYRFPVVCGYTVITFPPNSEFEKRFCPPSSLLYNAVVQCDILVNNRITKNMTPKST